MRTLILLIVEVLVLFLFEDGGVVVGDFAVDFEVDVKV